MQLTLYSTTTCPYCKMMKDYLTSKNVSFKEKVIDTDDAARDEMLKYSEGFLGVPFAMFQSDSGTMEKIIGFDKGKINTLLGISS